MPDFPLCSPRDLVTADPKEKAHHFRPALSRGTLNWAAVLGVEMPVAASRSLKGWRRADSPYDIH